MTCLASLRQLETIRKRKEKRVFILIAKKKKGNIGEDESMGPAFVKANLQIYY